LLLKSRYFCDHSERSWLGSRQKLRIRYFYFLSPLICRSYLNGTILNCSCAVLIFCFGLELFILMSRKLFESSRRLRGDTKRSDMSLDTFQSVEYQWSHICQNVYKYIPSGCFHVKNCKLTSDTSELHRRHEYHAKVFVNKAWLIEKIFEHADLSSISRWWRWHVTNLLKFLDVKEKSSYSQIIFDLPSRTGSKKPIEFVSLTAEERCFVWPIYLYCLRFCSSDKISRENHELQSSNEYN